MSQSKPLDNSKYCRCKRCKLPEASIEIHLTEPPKVACRVAVQANRRIAYLKGFTFGIDFDMEGNKNALQQLLKIFERERYDMVIWTGDPPAEDSFVAILLNIATVLPEATIVAGKRARSSQRMKERWTQFIDEKGSSMKFDIHEVPDDAFEENDWVALGGMLLQHCGPGDVHFFGGGENSLQQLAAMDTICTAVDPMGTAVYAYDVMRDNYGFLEHSSRLRTMVAKCHGTQEDGPGVWKHIRVLTLREHGVSCAVRKEPVQLRNLKAQLPSVKPPSPELVTEDFEIFKTLAFSMGIHLRVENVVGDGACQFRALALQLWHDQEKHIEVREAAISQLTKEPAQYESIVGGQSFSEYCEQMKQRRTWETT